MVVPPEVQRSVESRYAASVDGVPARCEAAGRATGEPPAIYGGTATAVGAARAFHLLGADLLWYVCDLSDAGRHYHLCPPELVAECPLCCAAPGTPCLVMKNNAPVWLEQPHPERADHEPESTRGDGSRAASAADGSLVEWLRGDVAVMSLATTNAIPPLIYQAILAVVSNGQRAAGQPLTFWVQPDTFEANIPAQAWPNVRHAPTWDEVAEWITPQIIDRVVVVYDDHAAAVLRTHLPDYPFRRILTAVDIGKQTWPDLYRAAGPALRRTPPYQTQPSAQLEAMTELVARVLIFEGAITPRSDPPHGPAGDLDETTEKVGEQTSADSAGDPPDQ